jgi:hypothetical protein
LTYAATAGTVGLHARPPSFPRRRGGGPGPRPRGVGRGVWERRAEATFVQRVDAGGSSAYTDLAGNLWAADQAYAAGGFGFVGGSSFTTAAEIANTSDDPLYRTNRNAPSFEYRFDVPSDTYRVLLRFAEIHPRSQSVGSRVLDVSIEGSPVLTGFDVFARVAGNAAINAISVEAAAGGDFTFTASPTSVTMSPGGSASLSTEVAFVNGFTTTDADLWATGVPGGVTAVYAPDPLTHEGMSQLTFTGERDDARRHVSAHAGRHRGRDHPHAGSKPGGELDAGLRGPGRAGHPERGLRRIRRLPGEHLRAERLSKDCEPLRVRAADRCHGDVLAELGAACGVSP